MGVGVVSELMNPALHPILLTAISMLGSSQYAWNLFLRTLRGLISTKNKPIRDTILNPTKHIRDTILDHVYEAGWPPSAPPGCPWRGQGPSQGASQHFESHLKAFQQSLAHPSSPQDSSTSLLFHSWGRLGVPSCSIIGAARSGEDCYPSVSFEETHIFIKRLC